MNELIREAHKGAKGERAARIAKAFKDGIGDDRGEWLLLNASDEQLRDIASEYPADQVTMLARYVEQARAAASALQAFRRDGRDEDREAADRAVNSMLDILRDHGWSPVLEVQADGASWGFSNRFHGKQREGEHALFHDASWPIIGAFHEVTKGKLYVCEWCGRIGPADRRTKRYCGDVCRASASRARQMGLTE